jgi:nicotinamidase-related amidase
MIEIDARPARYACSLRACALVIVDMQRDFLEPGGFGACLGHDVVRMGAIVPTVARVLQAWRACCGLVVHTREGYCPDLSGCGPLLRGPSGPRIGDRGPMGRFLVRGEPGHQIVPALAPLPGELVIDRPGRNAFHATPLGEELYREGISHLLFMGVSTEGCVQTTMREANDLGYACLLIEDATDSGDPALKQAVLERLRARDGIEGWTASSAAVLAALAAQTPTEPAFLQDDRATGPACTARSCP